MPFFEFRQNNSGGRWKEPAGHVIIEADNAEEANMLAEDFGLYFDGCSVGRDCSCCGDRWSRQWDDGDGKPVPSHYDTPLPPPERTEGHQEIGKVPQDPRWPSFGELHDRYIVVRKRALVALGTGAGI